LLNGVATGIGAGVYLQIMIKIWARYFVGNGIPKRPNDLDYVKYILMIR
jgi:hypothetical protein